MIVGLIHNALTWALVGLCCAASAYAVCAAVTLPLLGTSIAIRRANHLAIPSSVTVLKPLCGAEPHLFENLATFCEQNHPRFQLLFGVSSRRDPAIAVVQQLREAYPFCAIDLVVDSRVHGTNLKVSNLINMAPHARYAHLVLADSDITVPPDYLRTVTARLDDHAVGVVTCLYRARAIGGWWPRVGALFINAWFAPSVRIAHAFGSRSFGFGATLAFHKLTLLRIGGFEAIKDCLADDYMLALLARQKGLATVLSPMVVTTDVTEPTIDTLSERETRWLRTIRSVNPVGYASLFITFTTLWLLLGVALADASSVWAMPAAALTLLHVSTLAGAIARLVLHVRSTPSASRFWLDLPLIPVRDVLLALQWIGAMGGAHVVWRNVRVPVGNANLPSHHD
ncbi:bacteriohopanetetrol glucosamine biosynthesis glycosyltransferase HpnI [Burkholderia multivorans]|uniref:bacteriohopanetetrol glucosamine biosynthesis glycosyltransferase HpnI n=1 Tax=Burkholderia multivorans TaxID=87883 RepID=UPI000CFFAC3B|nr:bacteriohopanetetrol glucosamine biosynthesis glycosyltransferase HpnI [Burkholderia multivorans]PRG34740.1 glycosyl transferase [Burkholderia multivorans]